MAINFKIFAVFGARDKQSKAFNKMGKNAKRFGETSSRAFKKASKSARGFDSVTKSILKAGAVQKVLQGISTGVVAVTTDFLNFDNAILSASAKFKGLDLTTKAGIKTLGELKKTARLVGRDTEFNAAQAAGGLDFLALAGFNAQQAMTLLPGVTNLATVAQVDLATATDIASDSLGAFGLMTKDNAKLAENFTRVQDVMAKTTATSNTNLIDLFEAVKKGAPDFTAAGQSIETFSTLVGAMANSGIKGAEAGTKLRNFALRLSNPTSKAATQIENLGIKVADSEGNFRDMLDIIDDVIKGTSKMGSVQRTAALATIFGARQTGGLNVILKDGTQQLRSYRDMLIASKGAAEKMATIMRSSLMNRLKSLGSAATEVGFQLFSAFDKQGATAIETLTQAVRKIDLAPFIAGIKNAWENGKLLLDVIEPFTFLIPTIVTSWLAWNAVLKAQAAIGAIQMLFAMTKAIQGATVAQKLFNLAMSANPIGLVVVAVAGLIALTFTLVKNWDAISDSIGRAIAATKALFGIKDPNAGAAASSAADTRKALDAVGKIETINKKVDFAKGGILTAIAAKINPEFAARKSAQLSAQANKPFAAINEELRSARESQGLNAPPQAENGRNDINLDITGAPETATVKQKTSGRAKPINVTGLGRPAALAGP